MMCALAATPPDGLRMPGFFIAADCSEEAMGSRPDRMPRGLELEEIADRVQALCRFVEPAAFVGIVRKAHAFDALRGSEPQGFALVGVRRRADRAQMSVRGKRGYEFRAKTR